MENFESLVLDQVEDLQEVLSEEPFLKDCYEKPSVDGSHGLPLFSQQPKIVVDNTADDDEIEDRVDIEESWEPKTVISGNNFLNVPQRNAVRKDSRPPSHSPNPDLPKAVHTANCVIEITPQEKLPSMPENIDLACYKRRPSGHALDDNFDYTFGVVRKHHKTKLF